MTKPSHPAIERQASALSAFWLLGFPLALILGFLCGETVVTAAVAAATIPILVLVGIIRIPGVIKLVFLLVSMTFVQRVVGYVKFSDIRGLNFGNFLLLIVLGYWLLRGMKRGRLYTPSPIDFWIVVALIAIPILSILTTLSDGKIRGYSLVEELTWFKQWATPVIYFLLLCQCLERREDVKLLFYLVLGLVTFAVLWGLPEALQITNWHIARAQGVVQQPNDYAALLAIVAPFLFLVIFLLEGRPLRKFLSAGILACIALSIVTTYSRAGYLAFAVALFGAGYLAYRGKGRLPLYSPVIVVAFVGLVPFAAMPDLFDSIQERFAVNTYKRAKRKSYSRADEVNEYFGGRMTLWNGAIAMAEDKPIFGVGFHTFERQVPKYAHLRTGNVCHNQFLGALAEGGIIWLSAMLVLFWKLLKLLYYNWRVCLSHDDKTGQLICGGSIISFVIMVWVSFTNDSLAPGPKSLIFWVIMAGAVRYGVLAREEAAVEKACASAEEAPDG